MTGVKAESRSIKGLSLILNKQGQPVCSICEAPAEVISSYQTITSGTLHHGYRCTAHASNCNDYFVYINSVVIVKR